MEDNYKIEISTDYDSENPYEEWGFLGTFLHWHRQGFIGEDIRDNPDRVKDFEIVLPVYLYEHGGQTISDTPFSCRWDSGQVGYIGVTREKILAEYNTKYITKSIREKVLSKLRREIKILNQWLTGDVHGYTIYDKQDNVIEALWGIYGYSYAEEEAQSMLDYLTQQAKTQRIEKLKDLIKNGVPLEVRREILASLT